MLRRGHALAASLPVQRGYVLAASFAVVTFWLAFDGGTYSLTSRTSVGIALWWTIGLALILRLWPLAPTPRAALVSGGFLVAFAAWTLASTVWARSAEGAFVEFNRVVLYAGVFAATIVAGTRAAVARWIDGIAIGVSAVSVLALISRFFPGLGGEREPLVAAVTGPRLSYPLDYWNGLAVFCALGVPLLLRAAVVSPSPLVRGFAVAPLPAIATVIYLASSRGGTVAACLATALFVALAPRRWLAAAAAATGAAGAAGAIAVVGGRSDLVNAPETAAAADQGRGAAVLMLLLCAAVGAAYAFGSRYVRMSFRVPPRAAKVALALVLLFAIVGVAAADPGRRLENFKQPPPVATPEAQPTEPAEPADDPIRAHLLSGSGSGRWQQWAAAIDQFESNPVAGEGAGSYEAWWAQHGTLPGFVKDAHSLYIETLGELGIVGFALVVALFASGFVVGVTRLLGAHGEQRATLAALVAGFAAYAFAAGIDWMWEMTAVSAVGITFLGLLVGPATEPSVREVRRAVRASTSRALSAALVVGGSLLLVSQAIPLLAQLNIEQSQVAVRRGDAEAAAASALSARSVQPWAASPYLQLALVAEEADDLTAARAWIGEAIERDGTDWRLWLVASRIEAKRGDIAAARRSVDRARTLNPRSPLFARS